MDGWVDGRIDRLLERWVDGWVGECIVKWIYGQMLLFLFLKVNATEIKPEKKMDTNN